MVEESLNEAADGDERHCPQLLSILAAELGCDPKAIKDVELTLTDTQPGATWGASNEFLSAPRLDNQIHCFTSLEALIGYAAADAAADAGIAMTVCFDHEEVGSESAHGAGSPVMGEAISRVVGCFGASSELLQITLRRSFLISADVAHSIHPNWGAKHDSNHQPKLNAGTVIKTNDNQRYATNSVTGFLLRQMAALAKAPVQEFVVRNDCPCGTTIGPIISARVGLRTVDIGVPSLSMHSIRETIGVADIATNTALHVLQLLRGARRQVQLLNLEQYRPFREF